MEPNQILSKWFVDFCNAWGNISSVVGLVLSVAGFVTTIIAVLKAKSAAQKAADAAETAKARMLQHETVANFSSVIARMEEMMRLHRKKDWDSALDRQFELRRLLSELKGCSEGISPEQQTVLQGCIEQFKTIENAIEKFVQTEKTEPRADKLNKVVREQISKLEDISIVLKKRS